MGLTRRQTFQLGEVAALDRQELLDFGPGFRVAQRYRVNAVGTTYVVGRDGSVRWHGLWLGKEKVLLRAIAQAAA